MATNDNLKSSRRLQKLSGSDYEIADGEPNIKGWDVKDAQGRTIGEVDELIFDVQSLKVRYMVVDLDDEELDIEDKDVLIPIGLAQLDDKDDDVILPNVTVEQLRALPEYDEDHLTPEFESSVRNVFADLRAAGAVAAGSAVSGDVSAKEDTFYNHDHFNENNLYNRRRGRGTGADTTSIPIIEENVEVGKRTVETGGVRLRSRIVERPVEENINLREEHVNVERIPVDRPATDTDLANIKEGTIELTEKAEVPVVNKEARVVEEITLSKEVSERDETVRDTVRKTEVEVDKTDQSTERTNTYREDDSEDTNIRPNKGI